MLGIIGSGELREPQSWSEWSVLPRALGATEGSGGRVSRRTWWRFGKLDLCILRALEMSHFLAHHRDLRGREARPVLLGPSESQGDPGPKDLQGRLGRKELL